MYDGAENLNTPDITFQISVAGLPASNFLKSRPY